MKRMEYRPPRKRRLGRRERGEVGKGKGMQGNNEEAVGRRWGEGRREG